MARGNPVFTIRLPKEVHEQIRDMAKVFGSANPREFLRELIMAVLSGDQKQVAAFNARLITRMGEQLTLDLAQKAQEEAKESKKKPIKRTGKGKGSTNARKRV